MFRKQIVLLTKIDPELIEFQLPVNKKDVDNKGAKFFNMFYTINGKKSLINIQLPKLVAPFGLSGYTDEKGETNYSVALELKQETKAYKILKQIEEKALQFVVDNVDYFYKKKSEKENVRAFAKPFIKQDEDEKYPPSISIKMKRDKANPEHFDARADIITQVEDDSEPLIEENQVLTIDSGAEYITQRCEIQSVINAYGYQVDTKYGVSLKTVTLRVFTNGGDQNTFLEDSDSDNIEEEVEEQEEPVVEETKPKGRKKKTIEE